MKKIFCIIAFVFFITDLLLLSVFLCYKIDYEKSLYITQLNLQSASVFEIEGKQSYAQAMKEKEEAERYRKNYYDKVFFVDENGEKDKFYKGTE